MDAKDGIIYRILNMNGRVKLTTLSEALNFSPPSTKERLDKLLKRGDLAVKGLLNIQKKGWKTAVCNIQADNMEEAMKLADRFKNCPRVIFSITTSGAYNLFLVLVGDSTAILESTIENDIRPIPTIKKLDICVGDAPVVPEFVDLKVVDRHDTAPCGTKPCSECYLYEKKCAGCPATYYFKGVGIYSD